MEGYLFERAVVEVFIDISELNGVKAAPLSRHAWPDAKDAPTKWRKIRNSSPPQEMTVRDAHRMALALGVTLAEVCGMAVGRMLEGGKAGK